MQSTCFNIWFSLVDLIIPDGESVAQPAVKKRRDKNVFESVCPASGEDEPAARRERLELTILAMTRISEDKLAFGHG